MSTPSKIFTGFRALGFTSNHVPLAVRYHKKHKENYVVTCVGKAFHTYNCSKLGIISVSNTHEDDITCLAVDARQVYTAAGTDVHAFARGRQIEHTYIGHEKPVHLLLPFGKHLISVDEASVVKIWDLESEELYMELEFDNQTFRISALLHPNTYLNKILFASNQGSLQLWNIRTGKQLYTFKGWNTHITALEQAPAVDVVAIGLADGRVILHNLKYDETVMKFTQDWGPVTSIAFRTDGHPIMVTGSSLGHIALWNLEEKKLQSQMLEAHSGPVTGMKCLPSEPLMVTSSPDNSVKVWIFDQPDGGGRLLRQRSGHSEPPNRIRHHGPTGENILSAGQDSTLRSFSTVHDRHNKSLGRASYNKAETKKSGLKLDQHKMPAVTEFASESLRQSDWDSIVCCHRGLSQVTTWNYQRSTMGAHRLQHERFTKHKKCINATATCATVSSCGNFTVIGYSTGHCDKYNIQSGILRGTFGQPRAHDGGVRGVTIDGLNELVITAGADCLVKFWKFKSSELLESVTLPAQVASFCLHRESSMLAVALDDFVVVIIDIDTRKIVRNFTGHRNTVTDLAFSPDSRWLLTASMDSTLRTWDLPSGSLLDCFLTHTPITSMSVSPTGNFLATCHIDDVGIYLWSNMTLYKHVNLRPLTSDYMPQLISLPSTSHHSKGLNEETEVDEEDDYEVSEFKSPAQISDELVTLSLLPASRWQNLLNLEVIKQRNKPKEAPKVPKNAPFFLPTIAGLELKFDVPEESSEKESRVISKQVQSLSPFGRLVWETQTEKNYSDVMDRLKALGPSAVDSEFRQLSPDGGGSVDLMTQFMEFLQVSLNTNCDFELVQSYLGLFLKLHGETIASEASLVEALEHLQTSQLDAWDRLQKQLNQSLCIVNYLKSATI